MTHTHIYNNSDEFFRGSLTTGFEKKHRKIVKTQSQQQQQKLTNKQKQTKKADGQNAFDDEQRRAILFRKSQLSRPKSYDTIQNPTSRSSSEPNCSYLVYNKHTVHRYQEKKNIARFFQGRYGEGMYALQTYITVSSVSCFYRKIFSETLWGGGSWRSNILSGCASVFKVYSIRSIS